MLSEYFCYFGSQLQHVSTAGLWWWVGSDLLSGTLGTSQTAIICQFVVYPLDGAILEVLELIQHIRI